MSQDHDERPYRPDEPVDDPETALEHHADAIKRSVAVPGPLVGKLGLEDRIDLDEDAAMIFDPDRALADLPEQTDLPEDEDVGPKYDVEAFLDEVDLGEIAELEKLTEQKIGSIMREFEANDFGAATLIGLVFLMLRRDDPDVTMEDAKRVKLVDLADVDEDDDLEPSPKDE